MKKLTAVIFCILVWSGQAWSAQVIQTCQTATITATTPTADFVDHGDGTVTHTKTGLMWKQCSEGLSGAGCATGAATVYSWQAALQRVQALNAGAGFAGFKDWRLPNQKELNSIVERQCINPSINATIFPATSSTLYWSASPVSNGISTIRFDIGSDVGTAATNNNPVRLVRGGF